MIVHFDLNMFRPSELKRVKISLACVFAFMGIGWPLIVYKAGILGWIKFWLMPFLGYHFWVTLLPIPLCFNLIAVISMYCCCFDHFYGYRGFSEFCFSILHGSIDEHIHNGTPYCASYTFQDCG